MIMYSQSEGCNFFIQPYHKLWNSDVEAIEKEFLAHDPSLGEFENEIIAYDAKIDDINEIAEYIVVGSISLQTGTFR